MNRPNRHMRYRRSIYRKKRIKIILLCSVCTVVAISLLLLIIGNFLGKQVEESIESRNAKATQAQEQSYITPRSVNAYPVELSDSNSSLSERLRQAVSDGYSDICFNLDTSDGSMLYSSDIATALGKQPTGSELWKLSSVTKLAKENGLYTVGITHISDFSNDNDLIRSAALGYHSALISEALRSGVDEVLIFVKDISSERYSELIWLAEEIKRLCPDGIIGISLSVSAFSDTNDSTLTNGLLESFDYLAADLTNCESNEIADELGQMLYYLLRYNVRVLVPYSDDYDDLLQMQTAVNNSGSKNIQIMPQ